MQSSYILPEDLFSGEEDRGSEWPLSPMRPDFKLYPRKVENGGYVYCFELDGGLVKVGRTNNPAARLRTHYVDSKRFGVQPVRVWISPAHKEFARSELLMLRTLRRDFQATGPESFQGDSIFEYVRTWWLTQKVYPPGQTEEEAIRQEEGQRRFTQGLRKIYGEPVEFDPLAGIKNNSGLMASLSMFFSEEPVESRPFLRDGGDWSVDAMDTARELFDLLERSAVESEADAETATWLDLMEHMAFMSIRAAKYQLIRELKEVERGTPMMERLVDTIPGANEVVA